MTAVLLLNVTELELETAARSVHSAMMPCVVMVCAAADVGMSLEEPSVGGLLMNATCKKLVQETPVCAHPISTNRMDTSVMMSRADVTEADARPEIVSAIQCGDAVCLTGFAMKS